MKKTTKAEVNLEFLTKMVGAITPDEFQDRMDESSEAYGYAFSEALKEGATEEEAEEQGRRAEETERDDYFTSYYNDVTREAERLFAAHGLTLVPKPYNKKDTHPWMFIVQPETSWRDAGQKLLETINGVGYFHFSSIQEWLRSGPWTLREAVLGHLGWMKDWYSVYGERRPRRFG